MKKLLLPTMLAGLTLLFLFLFAFTIAPFGLAP